MEYLSLLAKLEWGFVWALLLVPIMPLVYFFWPNQQSRAGIYLPIVQQLNSKQLTSKPDFHLAQFLLKLGIFCLLLTAAARPQLAHDNLNMPHTGRDLLLVDTSGSMKERDMQLNNRRVSRCKRSNFSAPIS